MNPSRMRKTANFLSGLQGTSSGYSSSRNPSAPEPFTPLCLNLSNDGIKTMAPGNRRLIHHKRVTELMGSISTPCERSINVTGRYKVHEPRCRRFMHVQLGVFKTLKLTGMFTM
ncbi:hypothetical protein EYF80_049323 [Liparis tanakae]|uniref:Uncharacterized protein n=1 Tax=Liparis tanakae TaxID=230148 RepID=A0A4Z2FIA4_9TELE|nr:hypothetical protein EYF80_049323 [Liparis tanakae]